MSKITISGKTALITGAASGIGRAVAISLAKRGANLCITDINEKGLVETAEMLKPYSIQQSCHYLDVSDAEAIAEFPATVLAAHKGLDILVNNAGVALGGSFEQVSAEEFEWLFNINFWGVVRMTRAFLPMLKQSREAQLVNLSSVFGLFGVPKQVAYCSAKFGVRGFSEALREELLPYKIGVSVVHPGGIATNIANAARMAASISLSQEEVDKEAELIKKTLVLDPAMAGEIIVKGIEERKKRILVGNDAQFIAMVVRLFPVSYWKVLGLIWKTNP
jgi:NAD(P)-dependent dehydrogenase (short-subunit alcohol dehydrogenase family)